MSGLKELLAKAEPFFRLADAVVNPVNGDRPWHADSADWTVVFSFAGESLTLGDLRKAASRTAVPALLDENEALKKDVRRLSSALVDISVRVGEPGEIVNASHRGQALADVRRMANAAIDYEAPSDRSAT